MNEMIKSLKIINCKGIKSKEIKLQIHPNKLSILVAPNGFGKTSITHAFSSLKKSGIVFENDYDYYESNKKNHPEIQLVDESKKSLIANLLKNEISEKYHTTVINSRLYAAGESKYIGARRVSNSTLSIEPVLLYKDVPKTSKLTYSFIDIINYYNIKKSKFFDRKIDRFKKEYFDKISSMQIKLTSEEKLLSDIKKIIDFIDSYDAPIPAIKKKVRETIIPYLSGDLADLVGFQNNFNSDPIDSLINAIFYTYVIKLPSYNDYLNYKVIENKCEKIRDSVLNLFNREDKAIRIINLNNSLYFSFPSPDLVSNGERDFLSLIVQLKKAEIDMNEAKYGIIIIDEVFDYLDDANLIAAQYFLCEMIKKSHNDQRNIYYLLMTHLNPEYYITYSLLQKNRLNIVFINQDSSSTLKKPLIKKTKELIQNRENPEIRIQISRYFLHFHNDIETIKNLHLNETFKNIGLYNDWDTPEDFINYCSSNLEDYKNEKEYDPYAVAIFIRHMIEKIAFSGLKTDELKEEFIRVYETKDKIKFARDHDVTLENDAIDLLYLIYNPYIHIENNKTHTEEISNINLESVIFDRLNNLGIRKMIINLHDVYQKI